MNPHRLGYVALALAIGVVMILAHHAAGLTLPAPWGDEAYFVWQARAFERFNSFVAPELDPTRPYFLLPFVHGAVLGVTFKVFGYSFELARAISLVFTLIGFGCLAFMIRRHAMAPLVLALVGALMLDVRFVVLANNARMEAFVFAAVCAALLLIQEKRVWFGLGVLAATPMIHPNGVFFLVPAAVYAWLSGGLRGTRPSRGAWIVIGMAALFWLANGLYALAYWDGFKHETALRFGETLEKHGGLSQFPAAAVVGLALIVGTGVFAHLRRSSMVYLALFALGAWLCSRIRIEQWYFVFEQFAYLLVSIAWLQLIADELSARAPRWSRWTPAVLTAATLVFAAFHYRAGYIEGPVDYFAGLELDGMKTAPKGESYFTDSDREAITQQLERLNPGCPVVVEIYPWGDALLVAKLGEGRVRFQVPYFDPFFQPAERWAWGYAPTVAQVPDLYILRASRYQPSWLKSRDQRFLNHVLERAAVAQPTVFHTRDSTEIWYAVQPARAPRQC